MKSESGLTLFTCGKWWYLLMATFHTFLLSGLVIGWSPLLSILMAEGQYLELCTAGAGYCVDAVVRLNLIFSTSVIGASIGPLPLGFVMDKFGPRFSRILSIISLSVGFLLFSFSDSKSFDAFVPGMMLIAFGGAGVQLTSFNIANLFGTKWVSSILSLITGCYAGSGYVFALFLSLYTANSTLWSRKVLFLVYLVVIFISLVTSALFWPSKAFELDLGGSSTSNMNVHAGSDIKKKRPDKNKDNLVGVDVSGSELKIEVEGEVEVEESSSAAEISDNHDLNHHRLGHYSLKQMVFSAEYLWIMGTFTVMSFITIFKLGTVNSELDILGAGPEVLSAFAVIQPAGFFLSTAVGWILDHVGLGYAMLTTLICGLFYVGLSIIPNVDLQYFVFFVFSICRLFTYASAFSAIAYIFGHRHYGFLVGLTNAVSGGLSQLQPLLLTFILTTLHGQYWIVNTAFLVLMLPLFYFPFKLLVVDKRVKDIELN